jgi:hypothetical protein
MSAVASACSGAWWRALLRGEESVTSPADRASESTASAAWGTTWRAVTEAQSGLFAGKAYHVAESAAQAIAWDTGEARPDAPGFQVARQAAAQSQCNLLRDIAGNPFRPSPPLPPAVLAWHEGTVHRIAEGIYEDRQLPAGTLDAARLAVLADALLDAGCEDEALLAHCRSEGPHERGCWAVDLVLGKS